MVSEEKRCPYCGEVIKEVAVRCPHCKTWLNDENQNACKILNKLPKECKKFNWGAFFLTWIWGLGNRTYITFLAIPAFLFSLFVPILHLAVAIWFGVQGNEWAWKNNKCSDAAVFNKSQTKWAVWGTIIGLFLTCLKIGIFVFMVVLLFTSGVAEKAYDKARKTDACIQYEAIKNSPNMNLETLVKYRDLKDECGAEFLFAIIEKLAE